MTDLRRHPLGALLAVVHGGYYVVTGVWPLVHLPSFLFVTGPKADLWLVQSFGALVAALGVAFAVAGLRRQVSSGIAIFGITCSSALAMVDIGFVSTRVIAPVYLLDAAAELSLAVLWGCWVTRSWLTWRASREASRRYH